METWSYLSKKFYDRRGGRWHFMFPHRFLSGIKPDEQPYALFFRDDERTVFGVLRFERIKDNPYASLDAVTRKIMNDTEFRVTLLDDDAKKNWATR